MNTTRKVILYIAASLDGYIAKPNDDLSFLSLVQQNGEDYGYNLFKKNVDTVIMGRKTFDWVKKEINALPHPEIDTYVITRKPQPPQGKTQFYTGDIKALIVTLKSKNGKNIYCDGGAEIVHELLKNCLIDEIILSVIPILLGNGTRLFNNIRPEEPLTLLKSTSFNSGLVQLHYRVNHISSFNEFIIN